MMVELDWLEIDIAALVAARRQHDAIQRRAQSAYGHVENGLGVDAQWQGCIAEIAVCKHLGTYWTGLRHGAVDAKLAEVRSIDKAGHKLILHPDDRDLPFVLALVERRALPWVDLVGWIEAGKGRRADWWQDPRHEGRWAFFVPPGALQPMEKLRAYLGIW
jgi:hypothetical protein